MGPSREQVAEQRARNAQAAAMALANVGASFQGAANNFQQVANTHQAIAAQMAMDNANMTNFINGQLQSAQMSTMNRELSGINNSLMYMQRSAAFTPTFTPYTPMIRRW